MAHGLLRLARQERLGELAACRISARAAVDLVIFGNLSDAGESRAHKLLIRLIFDDRRCGISRNSAMRKTAPGARADGAYDIRLDYRSKRRTFRRQRRAVYASARTSEHFNKYLAAAHLFGNRRRIDTIKKAS